MKRVRENAHRAAVLGALLLGWIAATGATAAEPKKAKAPAAKAKKKAPEEAVAPESPPRSPKETALASCKKHVESMLKESAVTRFQGDHELKIEHPTDANYDISGWVTSENNSGAVKRMDFLCRAQSSGGLWTTKTSLFMDK